MRTFLFVFILTIFSSNILAQSDDLSSEAEKFKSNNIKEQIQWTHKYVKGEPEADGRKNSVSYYDKDGFLIKKENYDRAGNISSTFEYKYDKKGRKIVSINNDLNSKSFYKQETTYSGNKKVIEKTESKSEGGINKTITSFSYKNDNLEEIIKKNMITNQVQARWTYAYEENKIIVTEYLGNSITNLTTKFLNSNKHIEKEIVEDKKNKVNIVTNYQYDQAGNNTQITEYRNDVLTKNQELKYDNHNNLVEIINKQPDGSEIISNKYVYGNNKQLEEELWHERNDNYSKKTLKYNEKDLLIETYYYYALYKYQLLYKFTYETY